MIVGEAWGREEALAREPFVGPAGKILNNMLSQVGIDRRHCYLTNVFNLQPEPTNDITNLCSQKLYGIPGMPALQAGKYVRAQYADELTRLYSEVTTYSPTLIIALGATASWALLHTSGIRKVRGAPSLAVVNGRRFKVLPTYHPAAVMREFTLRPIVIADLEKARREAEFPELRRPRREIWIEPTIADLVAFERDHILGADDLSVDIETAQEQITCVGFAPSHERAIVVPFVDALQLDGNYWRTLADELIAWEFVRRWLRLAKRIGGQNFLYDTHWLWRKYGLAIPHSAFDTMLMHHAMQPELEKGLGFLATVYTDELAWKFMRAKHETLKKED